MAPNSLDDCDKDWLGKEDLFLTIRERCTKHTPWEKMMDILSSTKTVKDLNKKGRTLFTIRIMKKSLN